MMIFHIMFKSRPKLCIVVLKDHGNNLVQEKTTMQMELMKWLLYYGIS
jgi:hypothetical protein